MPEINMFNWFKRTKNRAMAPQVMVNGRWVDAIEIQGFGCEHPGCRERVGFTDKYIRKDVNLPNGWGKLPTYLCAAHAKGFEKHPDAIPISVPIWIRIGRVFGICK